MITMDDEGWCAELKFCCREIWLWAGLLRKFIMLCILIGAKKLKGDRNA